MSVFKTVPFYHQREAFELSKDREFFALAMEMGTGKSKIIVDTGAHLYLGDQIDAMLITAPNDVHLNWVEPGGEIDKHLSDDVPRIMASFTALARKAERKAVEGLFEMARVGLRIATCNVEALRTKKGQAFIRRLLKEFRVLWAVDESQRIKSPGATITKRALSMSYLAPYRRILSGTMAPNGPFDLFSQYKFLSPTILKQQNMTTFKARYAHLRADDDPLLERIRNKIPEHKRPFVQLVSYDMDGRPMYRNLDELARLREPHTYYKKKSECFDLPPRVYETRHVTMTTDQTRMIKELHASKVAIYGEDGGDPIEVLIQAAQGADTVRARNALAVHLREQQIIGGHAKLTSGEMVTFEKNPKLDSLLELLGDMTGRAIIWCRFTPEIEQIVDRLTDRYGPESVATYYGETTKEERAEVRRTFREADSQEGARFLVANPESGGLGLTLNAANNVVWYSADFNLMHYMQGNDRPYRHGQTRSVTVFHLIASGTIDARIMNVLAEKEQVMLSLEGDGASEAF